MYDVEPRPLTTGETMREKIAVAGAAAKRCGPCSAATGPASGRSAPTPPPAVPTSSIASPSADGAGCRFHRTLDFRSKGWPWRALDASVTRWVLERQSARALRNLKAVMEQVIAAQPIEQL